MTMVSAAKARSNVTDLLKRAAAGEKIGIRYGKKVLVMKVAKPERNDYAWTEYGLTRKEMKVIARKLHEEGEKDRREGKSREYKGDIEAVLKD
jgi:antitoxin (DNA-binding transcriptional repressor) of toxin-antitoxin stability system